MSTTTLPATVDSTTALTRYDAARKALAEARAVDEVVNIRAHADAMRAYAKQAKNRQMEVDAAEIRIRAERRLGELMAAQAETVGLAKGQLSRGVNLTPREMSDPPTLAEAGIDKNLAHRARTYAAVPEAQFEDLLTKKRRRESVRVVLDPDFQAEAELAARENEIERDERIALAGTGDLVDEIDRLTKQAAMLDRRISALLTENSSLKYREKMWRERAIAAGWKERGPDA